VIAKPLVAAHDLYTDESGRFWGNAGAGCVFQAEDTGRLLLQKRSPYVNEGNTWGTWGGAIDPGEDPEEALEREIEEETGYRGPKKMRLLHVYKDGNFHFSNYLVTVPTEFEPRHSWETSGHVWTTLDALPKPLHFGFVALLPTLRKAIE
jgi:8-oxo-dGTP pyrophosphatase MutT (NUDIX family)